jgi:hypothetical protein
VLIVTSREFERLLGVISDMKTVAQELTFYDPPRARRLERSLRALDRLLIPATTHGTEAETEARKKNCKRIEVRRLAAKGAV